MKNWRKLLVLPACLALGLLSPGVSLAAAEAKVGGSEVLVTAEGVVKAVPDIAVLRLAILTEAPKAQQATAENARLAEAMLTAVKKLLKDGDSLKSSGYRVQPVYNRPEKAKKPAIVGYQARHTFQLKIQDPGRLGEIIDVALQHGVGEVQGPWWEHSRLEALTQEAAVQALQKAGNLAEALAQSQKLKIKRILKITTSARPQLPPRNEMRLMAAAAAPEPPATPIEVGEEEIRAQVEAVFDLE